MPNPTSYIPSPEHWKDMFRQYSFYDVKERVSIKTIKINRTLFCYDNSPDINEIHYMVKHFEENSWLPIRVNRNFFLLDGQHRLACARKMGLKYIDVVVDYENSKKIETPKPFIKWAGGKRQLIDILLKNVPTDFQTYIEPFVGGGAMLFALRPNKAIISDINAELINAYSVVKKDAEALIRSLVRHKNEADHYYHIRKDWKPEQITEIQRASRFIYLNKTCFNGLYRENSKGEFNVPFGRYKNPRIINRDNLFAVSHFLNSANVRIENQDYKTTALMAKKGDFVYLDPPYHPISSTASFTKYSKGDFSEKDQAELVEVIRELDKRECFVVLSNSNTDYIKKLYKGFHIKEVEATRFINCKAEKRGKGLFEVVIKNW